MAGRPKLGRAVAAVTGASVAMMLAALPASAEDVPTAVVTGEQEAGLDVNLLFEGEEGPEPVPTRLSEIRVNDNGPAFQTYSLNPFVELEEGTSLGELPWSLEEEDTKKQLLLAKADGDDILKKINWALRHSYPFISLDALKSTLSLSGLDSKEAIAGTQAAIWHLFLEGITLAETNDADVRALYTYLTGDKNTGAENDVPTLEVTPATLSGKPGQRLGPVTVKTSAKEVTLMLPAGVKVTDKDGKEIAAKDIKDGTELFFEVPAGGDGEGNVEFKVTGETSRMFVNAVVEPPSEPETQLLVFAQKVTASVGGTITWSTTATTPPTTTTPPAPQASSSALANTGVSIYVPIGLGVLLLAAGAGALLFLRRRGRA